VSDLSAQFDAALADRYRIEREVGRGGMATVFLAEDLKHHRRVAIKVLHPEIAALLGPERFLREIEIAARLQHPHILPLHDSGEAHGLLYYVMPYVEGESLLAKRPGTSSFSRRPCCAGWWPTPTNTWTVPIRRRPTSNA
jgi:eukaryotic-like serine/threonine-protein kinase